MYTASFTGRHLPTAASTARRNLYETGNMPHARIQTLTWILTFNMRNVPWKKNAQFKPQTGEPDLGPAAEHAPPMRTLYYRSVTRSGVKPKTDSLISFLFQKSQCKSQLTILHHHSMVKTFLIEPMVLSLSLLPLLKKYKFVHVLLRRLINEMKPGRHNGYNCYHSVITSLQQDGQSYVRNHLAFPIYSWSIQCLLRLSSVHVIVLFALGHLDMSAFPKHCKVAQLLSSPAVSAR